MNYSRKENESDEELIYRICSEKEVIGSWQDVADILNKLLNTEYTESKFRKQYQAFNKMLSANEHKILDDDNYLNEIRIQKQELQKEKQKLSDERVELNRQIREQARKESYEDMIKRIVCENVEPIKFNTELIKSKDYDSTQDLLIHLTDIHTGIEIDNFKNVFNQDILKQRIEYYTNKIIAIKKKHDAQNCYIVISEILSGLIHNNLRLQNNMDLMEQFKYVSELIGEMLCELAEWFDNIYVYTVEGNHSRIVAKKEDSLQGENMDILLPFYLRARLQNYSNINIIDNKVCTDIAMFNIRGNNIFASHGDKDSPSSVVQNWTMMFGIKPNIVLLGHRHLNGLTTVYDTKVIESGCISGTDEYAMSIRKCNKPEQTISIIDKNGLVCLYDIQL
jgi:predicted phosphodiesterase